MDLAGMETAARRLRSMRRIAGAIAKSSGMEPGATMEPKSMAPFEATINDDFDTPRTISWVEATLRKGAKERDKGKRAEALARASTAMKILGVELLGTP
jgi:cysteinyl-tRNA synthetase